MDDGKMRRVTAEELGLTREEFKRAKVNNGRIELTGNIYNKEDRQTLLRAAAEPGFDESGIQELLTLAKALEEADG